MDSLNYFCFVGLFVICVWVDLVEGQVICPENEEYDPCFNPCPSQSCADIMQGDVTCTTIAPADCQGACKCSGNYKRNATGTCVPLQQCPALPCLGSNQDFYYCPSPCYSEYCDVSYCESPPDNYTCYPQCLCQKDSNLCRPSPATYECRPLDTSNICSSPNTVWSDCENNICQRTCTNINIDWSGYDCSCNSGCICAPGYLRHPSTGDCVLATEQSCGENVCTGVNERYTFCPPCSGIGCPSTCMGRGPSACVCITGYSRQNGVCTLINPCPTSEKYSFCGNNDCQRNCVNYRANISNCSNTCISGCICDFGYIRRIDGTCVPPTELTCGNNICGVNGRWAFCPSCASSDQACQAACVESGACVCDDGYTRTNGVCQPICTNANEVWTACGNNNCQQTCSNYYFDMSNCDNSCTSGCICRSGYIRNEQGNCVLANEVACGVGICGTNANYEFCPPCANNPSCNISCAGTGPSECVCNPGYAADLVTGCTAICTNANEVWSSCGNNSCQQDCSNYYANMTGCNDACNSGCVCSPGYIRNEQSVCVTANEAACGVGICGTNANYEFCPPCANNPSCNISCAGTGPSMCVCNPGYAGNPYTGCNAICSNANEVWTACDNNGCQQDCSNYNSNMTGCNSTCNSGCICATGYLRNELGVCVLANEAACGAGVCGYREHYKFCPPCANIANCTINCAGTGPSQCVCDAGFIRNGSDVCDCPAHEVWDSCFNPCPPQECSAIASRRGLVCPTISAAQCQGRCKCAGDLRRHSNGTCIPMTSCPPLPCNSTNQTFEYCPSPCYNEWCNSTSTTLTNCVTPNNYTCYPQCVCKKANGVCRPLSFSNNCRLINTALLCPRPNEVWSDCGNNSCQKTCANVNVNMSGCDNSCISGCICKPGYWRNMKGVCVLACEPGCAAGVCPANERYTFCPDCPPNRLNCPTTCMGRGPSQCVCVTGFIRNANGTCYKPPTLTCTGINKIANYCPAPVRNCTHVFAGTTPTTNSSLCQPACVCKPGFVRKSDTECVLPENCCSDPNAAVVSCPYNCGGGICANQTISKSCATPCPTFPKGCECKRGYTRRDAHSPTCISTLLCNKY